MVKRISPVSSPSTRCDTKANSEITEFPLLWRTGPPFRTPAAVTNIRGRSLSGRGHVSNEWPRSWNEHPKKNAKVWPPTISHAGREQNECNIEDNPIIRVSTDA